MIKQIGWVLTLLCWGLLGCQAVQPATLTPAVITHETGAGSLVRLSLSELVAQTNIILVGRVAECESRWNESHTTIYTEVVVTPELWIKHRTELAAVTLRIPGGQIGETVMTVSNLPDFHTGERVVLFLIERPTGYELAGGLQGKVLVENGQILASDGPDEALGDFVGRIQTLLGK